MLNFVWQAIDYLQTYNGAVTAFATFCIAAFTIVLAAVTGRQARLTRQSIDLARTEFVATHRPRVIVRFVQGPFYNNEGIESVCVTFANVGDTPATIYAIGADLARRNKISGEWRPPGLDADPKPVDLVTLDSGDRHVIEVAAKKPISDVEIFGDVMDTYQLCAIGAVKYRDGNGRTRETAFCRVSDGGKSFSVSENREEEYQD